MIVKAFKKGLSEVRVGDLQEVNEEIKAILKIKSPQQYAKYKDGRMKLDVEEYEAIKRVFERRGVKQPFGY